MMPVLESQVLVGYLALEKGFVTEDHLRACATEVKINGGSVTLDKLLVDKGYISESQRKVLNLASRHFLRQKAIPHFGEIALKRALITRQELEETLEFQENDPVKRHIGEILLLKGLLTFEEHFEILNSQLEAAKQSIAPNILDRIPPELMEALKQSAKVAPASIPAEAPITDQVQTPPLTPQEVAEEEIFSGTPATASGEVREVDPDAPDASTKVLGDYRVIRELGRGAMGVVYLAIQRSLKRKVALKVLPQSLTVSDRMISRFYREAELAARLQHPGIVQVYGMGEEQENHYFAMEFIEGVPLDEKLRQEFVDYNIIADNIAQAAEALDYAHQSDIIHRDIKPSNLMMTGGGKIKIADFGLARPKDAAVLTAAGTIVGTPMYMSPEQAQGHKKHVDYRTDIYSLGATMYFALTKRNPFQSEDVQAILRMVVESDPVEPRKVNPMIPRDLEVICLKAMNKDPRRRYQSAAEFAQDVRRHIAGEPILARSQTGGEKAARWVKKNRLTAALIVFGIALAALAYYFFGVALPDWRRKAAIADAEKKRLEVEKADANRRAREAQEEKERSQRESDEVLQAALKELENRLKKENPDPNGTQPRIKEPPRPTGEVAVLLGKAKEAIKRNEYTSALRFLDDAVAEGPQYFEPIFLRGTVYNRLGDWSNARADFDEAVKLRPGFGTTYLQRGIAMMHTGDLGGATRDFLIAIEMNPRNWSACEHLGEVYYEKNAYEQAIKQWEKALELNPKLKHLKRKIADARRNLK
ncbi:MAG: protein kinase domain-containing protein [Planctomycetota bacterium]|jgi:tetratricopeptide (TPR) repeat protein/predicted Ser/Thr protein kinase